MKSPKAPKSPDPNVVAQAQTGSNIGTAIAQGALNQNNQITPYGNLTSAQTGTYSFTDPSSGQTYQLPQYTQTQTLAPQQQQLLNSQTKGALTSSNIANQQLGKLGGILGTRVDTSKAQRVGMPTMGTVGAGPKLATQIASAGTINRSYGDQAGYDKQRQKVEDTLMARMNPSLEQERSRLTSQLANQGIKVGTEAYDREMQNYGQRTNDARYGAILNAGEEQSRLAGLDQNRAQYELGAQAQRFGQNATRAGFGNDANQQMFDNRLAGTAFNNAAGQQTFANQQGLRAAQLQEGYAGRNQSINEIATLLGLGQVQNPQFMGGPNNQVANTDTAGIAMQGYQNQMANWQQRNQQQQGMLGGLFGLGAAGIMASDRRLKTDVTFLGMLRDLPVYAWRYIWGGPMQVGVMAQDMLTIRPEAVVVTPSGFLAVNYARL
jgi:hypothetical protein